MNGDVRGRVVGNGGDHSVSRAHNSARRPKQKRLDRPATSNYPATWLILLYLTFSFGFQLSWLSSLVLAVVGLTAGYWASKTALRTWRQR